MLNEQYQDMVFDGIALREMSIDQLREQESVITTNVIRSGDFLGGLNQTLCPNVSASLQRSLNYREMELDIIKSEIAARYESMQTFA